MVEIAIYAILMIISPLIYIATIKYSWSATLSLTPLIIFAGLKSSSIAPDVVEYYHLYNDYQILDESLLNWGRIEPGFEILMRIGAYLSIADELFFFLFAIIQGMLSIKMINEAKTPVVVYAFVWIYYYAFFLNTIRFGAAVILFGIMLNRLLNEKPGIWYGIMASAFHLSAFPPVVLSIVLLLKRNYYVVIGFILLCVAFFAINSDWVLYKSEKAVLLLNERTAAINIYYHYAELFVVAFLIVGSFNMSVYYVAVASLLVFLMHSPRMSEESGRFAVYFILVLFIYISQHPQKIGKYSLAVFLLYFSIANVFYPFIKMFL